MGDVFEADAPYVVVARIDIFRTGDADCFSQKLHDANGRDFYPGFESWEVDKRA